jgi:hypothetical protein
MSSGSSPLGPYEPYRQPEVIMPGSNGGPPRVYPQLSKPRPKIWLHVLLFALTVASTGLFVGWQYSLCVMTILTFHEFGHFFAACYYHVPATLPYFIPFPSLFGTMGAVIRMSPFIPNRRALFDIAAAGPIAGLVVAMPVTIYGVATSEAEREALKEEEARKKNVPAASGTGRGRSTRMNPVVKVLTSATFIRGVMGILKKVMR